MPSPRAARASTRESKNPVQDDDDEILDSSEDGIVHDKPLNDLELVKMCIDDTLASTSDDEDVAKTELQTQACQRYKQKRGKGTTKAFQNLFDDALQDKRYTIDDKDFVNVNANSTPQTPMYPSKDLSDVARSYGTTPSPAKTEVRKRITKTHNESTREPDESDDDDEADRLHHVRWEGKADFTPFLYVAIMMVVVTVVGICFSWYTTGLDMTDAVSTEHSYRTAESYVQRVATLKSSLRRQDKLFWLAVEKIGAKHLRRVHGGEREDLRPLAFLVASYDKRLADCFVKKLARAFTDGVYSTLESASYSTKDVHQAKQLLDDDVKASLHDTQKLLVIKDVDALDFEVASLFMSYTDAYSEISHFPQSTILLTMQIPDIGAKSYTKEVHGVEAHFKNVYRTSDEDRVAPLWSRMGDGTIVLRSEDDICS